MDNDPRYEPIDAVLPKVLPPLTQVDALKYYRRLVKVFGRRKDEIPVGVLEARNGCLIQSRRTVARRVWASTKPTSGHYRGWGRLVHDASHHVFRNRHPHARPHDGGHAKLEREMAEFVVAKGWLTPKAKPTPTKETQVASRIARIDARIKTWESKQRRAENALKKLSRQRKYLSTKLVPTSRAVVKAQTEMERMEMQ